MRKVDFLVIGSGIAGLSFALKAAQHGKVLIVTKSNEDESNTKYAQGGVAVVVDKGDSFENCGNCSKRRATAYTRDYRLWN